MPESRKIDARAPAIEERTSIGSRYIRALLNRHGVPPMRHPTVAADILGVGYTPVHRRLKGEVAWELEEIETVARHFGETLSSLFALTQDSDYVRALLSMDGARLPCDLLIGDAILEPARTALVAVKVGAQWIAQVASKAGPGPFFAVRELRLRGEPARRRRIAIVDDDSDEASSLAEYFNTQGCEAQSFTEVAALLGTMKVRPFDAFVIDWVLDEGTASELVGMIRSNDPECPIAILTGKMEEDIRVESAVAEALSTYKLLFFQKPTRLPLISSQLLRALDAR